MDADCFGFANDDVRRNGGIVVHAMIHDPVSKKEFQHAWVERDGFAHDWHGYNQRGGSTDLRSFYRVFKPTNIKRYDQTQAMINCLRQGHHGPWMESRLHEVMSTYVSRHLNEEVREKFNISIPSDLMQMADMFERSGKKLFIVGGAIRDAIQGKDPKDWDVASSAAPNEVRNIISRLPGFKVLELGEAFGIVKVITPEKNEYEIVMFRRDMSSGRRPDSVEHTTIDQDVMRRDLTINALFYDISTGEIVDYVGGIQDIKNNVVKAVGDPAQRFAEDKLRILRALRFAARTGSKIDASTSEAIMDDNTLTGVSAERIRDEFAKGIRSSKSTSYFFQLIGKYDLWAQIFPGVKLSPPTLIDTKNELIAVAILLRHNDVKTLNKRLVTSLKWQSHDADQICFFIGFAALMPTDALKLKRLQSVVRVTPAELQEFQRESGSPRRDYVDAFIRFKPSIKPEDLMSRGFRGAGLGAEIDRQEAAEFMNLL